MINFTYPADVLAARNWKLTLPINDAQEITFPALSTYDNEWFHLDPAREGVTFKTPTDGSTTSGSGNPRTELREMTLDGLRKASWPSKTGSHTLDALLQINAWNRGSKRAVVIAQIHNSSDDVTVFRAEGNTKGDPTVGKIWLTSGDTSHAFLVTNNYVLGTRINIGFRVKIGVISYVYNGNLLQHTKNSSGSGYYFKVGSYNQSGGNVTIGPDGKADYCEVTLFNVRVCHDNVCAGTSPS